MFPGKQEDNAEAAVDNNDDANATLVSNNKYKGKKSKAAAKPSRQAYQWVILKSVGISDNEIAKFQDPYKWLTYFPPLVVEDLKAFGLGCDWRRSFITTDVNPYFNSFVSWQMMKLKLGKVVKDVRYTIFSYFKNITFYE